MFLVYRVCMTEDSLPWVSLVVHKTRLQITQDPSLVYEYLPGTGLKSFIQASLELLFGKYSPAIVENRAGGVHTVGESGAFQLGAQFLRMWRRDAQTVCIISYQKESHGLIFQDLGFKVREYCIWDPEHRRMDSNMFLDVVEQMPSGCTLVIGNPVDCRLTRPQWAKLMSTMKSKQIFPFFDIPCQGLSTGDLEEDAGVLQYFVSWGFEFFCSQSLSKNFGIYDEGVGVLVAVALSNKQLLCVLSQLMSYAQALWLSPPARGSRIITTILCNPVLQEEWKLSLKEIVENMMLIKEKVKEKLRLLGTPGSWDHITEQTGTHGYLGLNYQQVQYLIRKKHIYVHKNSRINFTCINAGNVDYITQSICEAVLATKQAEK
ncbi:putative aspartate aminotransferase, cytoplasmic 2 [Fukomys damarensis]|uniref:Putative aspartate aminotransferase, cytoplasmic 2 n=1 Tax=Fukomys damarensis TaxID=885580 RepID=A0A091E3C5_FUKDA|nr:putative aspartate aminotransferase, cytoplasmic 2 [Fukomys damarensis]KFO37065.1 Putative aspartate aminotransferase, cytoplasmic 2 [Fukomys damarensis]